MESIIWQGPFAAEIGIGLKLSVRAHANLLFHVNLLYHMNHKRKVISKLSTPSNTNASCRVTRGAGVP
jgi:hypothetical protein